MHRSSWRRAIAVGLALSISAVTAGCADESSSDLTSPPGANAVDTESTSATPDTEAPPATESAPAPTTESSIASTPAEQSTTSTESAAATNELELAGIDVVADERALLDTTPDAPLLLTEVQAERLLADVDPEGGALGADLDEVAPVPAGVPPMSFIIAAWVTVAETAGAETARGWMGEQDWENAPAVRFPLAVVALFVNDVGVAIAESTPLDDDTLQFDFDALRSAEPETPTDGFRAHRAQGGPCTFVQNSINYAFAWLVQTLRIRPVTGGGIFGDIANFFVTIFNTAVELAARVVQGLVETITGEVYNAIKVAISAIGVVTVFTSYFRDNKLVVRLSDPRPPGRYRFAIGDEPDIRGEFVASSRSLTGSWPDALVDCAMATNVTLPSAIGPGSPATWDVPATSLLAPGPTAGTVQPDLTARLSFVTGRESAEDATGTPTSGTVHVRVLIPRPDIEELLRFGRRTFDAARKQITSFLLIPFVRQAVDDVLASILNPLLSRLERELSYATAGLFTLSGSGAVNVEYHTPPEPPETPPPTDPPPPPPPPADFCALYRDLKIWMNTNLGTVDNATFATEVVRRLDEMRPIAPGEMVSEVDIHLVGYTAIADGTSGPALAVAMLPVPESILRVHAFCGMDPDSPTG